MQVYNVFLHSILYVADLSEVWQSSIAILRKSRSRWKLSSDINVLIRYWISTIIVIRACFLEPPMLILLEFSCWHIRYENKATLLLGWSHQYKYFPVIITNWLTVTIYTYFNDNGSFDSHLRSFFLSSITDESFIELAIWTTRRVSYNKRGAVVFVFAW